MYLFILISIIKLMNTSNCNKCLSTTISPKTIWMIMVGSYIILSSSYGTIKIVEELLKMF
jgi:hypothetical protein